ncbi:hypothetical protein HS125_04715 [bacterium]|nr:hypothetical protein [bacterium]
MRRGRLYLQLLIVGLCILGAGWYFYPRRFLPDPRALAEAETRMWQAYYGDDPKLLATELVSVLREQYGLSYLRAAQIGSDLLDATLAFQRNRDNYEEAVLPHLERAYGRLRSAHGGSWDAGEAARAELDWWAARRTPGRDNPEEVGRAIARLYAILYGKSNARIQEAGYLRARAANLRDRGGLAGPDGDWSEIQRLLEQSYTALVDGVR